MTNHQIQKHIEALLSWGNESHWQAVEALNNVGVVAVPSLIEALKHKKLYVRLSATNVLGKIGVDAVPLLIAALQDKSYNVRNYVAEALTKIGEPAVPKLLEALKEKDWYVRMYAISILGKIKDSSAVPELVEATKDKNEDIRKNAVEALGIIGDVLAVPALLEALKDKSDIVRVEALTALLNNGNDTTLPRRILGDQRLSPQQKAETLQKLRRIRRGEDFFIIHYYHFPETSKYCFKMLEDEDEAVRYGAKAVLNWLNSGQYLLRASQQDATSNPQELLRAATGSAPETQPETLLRAAESPQPHHTSAPKPNFWQRIFG